MKQTINIFWFRRDLRLDDNHGLFQALKGNQPVLPIFIFDTEILERLPKDDARVSFIYETLQSIRKTLLQHNSCLAIYFGKPIEIYQQLIEYYTIESVFTNHDYEPYALQRDAEIEKYLTEQNIAFHTFKDQVIFEKNDVTKSDGLPYVVYTPFMKAWKEKFKTSKFEIGRASCRERE